MPDFATIAADTRAPALAREGAAFALGLQAAQDDVRTCGLTDEVLREAWRRGWEIGANRHAGRGSFAARVADAMERDADEREDAA